MEEKPVGEVVEQTEVVEEIEQVEQVEAVEQSNRPIIRCTVSDPFVKDAFFFGGASADGRGFIMYKDADDTVKSMAIDGGIKRIEALYLDIKDDLYDIIAACYDENGCIVMIRIESLETSSINAVRISDSQLPITMLTKWNNEFLVGSASYKGDSDSDSVYSPIIIRLTPEFEGINAVFVSHMFPEWFTAETVIGKISHCIDHEDQLYIAGTYFTNNKQAIGFVSKVDDEYQPIVSCTIVSENSKYSTVDYLWFDLDNKTVTVTGKSMHENADEPIGFIESLNMDDLGVMRATVQTSETVN